MGETVDLLLAYDAKYPSKFEIIMKKVCAYTLDNLGSIVGVINYIGQWLGYGVLSGNFNSSSRGSSVESYSQSVENKTSNLSDDLSSTSFSNHISVEGDEGSVV